MVYGTRKEVLQNLRTVIDGLERRPVLMPKKRQAGADDALVLGAPPGLLHEVWGDHFAHAGSMLGFALGQATQLFNGQRQAVLYLGLTPEGQETGLVYGAGLCAFGVDPGRLIIGRMPKITDVLWAVEEAVASSGVAAVIADIYRSHKSLDFTVSRRLHLRTQAAGASVFMLRYGQEREVSAAACRWHVSPYASQRQPYDAHAPGVAQFNVVLEKAHGIGTEMAGQNFILGWTQDGLTRVVGAPGRGTAHSGAQPTTLGDRLPQTA